MSVYNNKLGIDSILQVEFPFGKNSFYSESKISNREIVNIILETITQSGKLDSSIFNAETMQIKIDDKKTLIFILEDEILNQQEYDMVEKESLRNGIKSKIYINTQRSILGTDLCIKILKKLQKKYPRSVFVDDYNISVRGDDIQKIKMNKKSMYDPDLREGLENIDEIMGKYGKK